MQAIVTKFIGPTNHRGSRYKASCDAGTLTLDADPRLGPEQNHVRVARALIARLGWFHEEERGDRYGRWYYGVGADGGHTFVCAVEYNELTREEQHTAAAGGNEGGEQ